MNATTCGARTADKRPTGFVLPASMDVGTRRGQTLPLETKAAHDGRNYNFFYRKTCQFCWNNTAYRMVLEQNTLIKSCRVELYRVTYKTRFLIFHSQNR